MLVLPSSRDILYFLGHSCIALQAPHSAHKAHLLMFVHSGSGFFILVLSNQSENCFWHMPADISAL